jgi:uncharacterized hydrophobic protein (TIGR00271 family)
MSTANQKMRWPAPGRSALGLGPVVRGFVAPVESALVALGSKRTPLAPTARAKVVQDLFHEGARRTAFLHRFYCLMSLSVVIAVLGLLANSTAVVIGAMLVAPLMAPVLGISAAIVMDWPRRALNAAITTSLGAALAVGLAALVSAIIPGDPHPLPAELLARTSPTLVDLGVALVAGAAGAYSHVRRQASDAIVGVAVAVALVPPLAVVGVTLEMGHYQMALGASLLFLANVSGIITAGAITFIAFGLVPLGRLTNTSVGISRGLRLATVGTLIIMAPLQIVDEWRPEATLASSPEELVMATVNEWRQDVSLISMRVNMETADSTPRIELTLAQSSGDGGQLGVEALADELAKSIGRSVDLVVTTLESNTQVATAESPDDEQEADIEGSAVEAGF